MKKLTKTQAGVVTHLAVCYEAYCSATSIPSEQRTPAQWDTVACWAGMLKEAQTLAGVELRKVERLDYWIARGKVRGTHRFSQREAA